MGEKTFAHFQQAIVNTMEESIPATKKDKVACNHADDDTPDPSETTAPGCDEATVKQDAQSVDDASTHQGKLILDATVAEQAIRFPIDLGLLNESREISEQIIDVLYPLSGAGAGAGAGAKAKPRRYRQTARKDYLGIVKQRQSSTSTILF